MLSTPKKSHRPLVSALCHPSTLSALSRTLSPLSLFLTGTYAHVLGSPLDSKILDDRGHVTQLSELRALHIESTKEINKELIVLDSQSEITGKGEKRLRRLEEGFIQTSPNKALSRCALHA